MLLVPPFLGIGGAATLAGAPSWVLRGGGVAANLDIDFVNDLAYNNGLTTIASLLTCTRASTGYYTNADGTLQSFSSNVLRYGDNGLLVEEARTNLGLHSQAFDNGSWTKGASTITADATAAPDGTTTADTFVEDSANAFHTLSRTFTAASATAYTFSVYAKAAGRTWIFLQFDASLGFAGDRSAFFDIGTGAVGTTQADTTASIEALANGWYRCRITATSDADGGTGTAKFILASNGSTINYQGDGVSGVYLWGAQVEAGAFATSYIPTTSSSATRAADAVSVMTSSIPSFSATAGTIYAQELVSTVGVTHALVKISDAGNNEMITAFPSAGDAIRMYVYDGGVAQADISTGNTISVDTEFKAAAAWAANDFAVCLEAGTVATDTSGTLPTVDRILIGQVDGPAYHNGYINRLAYWNTRLSNAALQVLTPPEWVLEADDEFARLDIDFVEDVAWNNAAVSISSLLTCTRASSGYYTHADGTLESFSSNVLRYGTNGLLVEEGRTNRCLQSQTFDNATWSKTDATVTANAATAPDGTATADKLIEAATSGLHGMAQSFNGVPAGTRVFTVYAKAAERSHIHIDMSDNAVASFNYQFQLSGAGSIVGTSGASGDWTDLFASIEALANGWYRLTLGGTLAHIRDCSMTFFTHNGSAVNYAGDGASGIYLWQAQHEMGAFPTSPILTTTTSATRAADNVVLSSNLGDGAVGTFYSQAVLPQVVFGARIWGSQLSSKTQVFQYAGNTTSGAYNGAVEINTTAGSGGWATGAKNATAFDGSGFAHCFNAGTVSSDADTSGYDEEIQVGSYAAASDFANGYLKRLAFWTSRLSNSALQSITT